MDQYHLFELTFQGEEPVGSQAIVELDAVFCLIGNEGERTDVKKIKGFYAGNGTYKVRFLPLLPGVYEWKVSGCVTGDGFEMCIPASNESHGIVRASGTNFHFDDGTSFLPVGTTIYAFAHQEKGLMERTYETLRKAPFNKIRHCVFPKHFDYNHNEPELFAYEQKEDGSFDVNRPCFAFWDHFEKVIFTLAEMGIQNDIILFHPYDHWGFSNLTGKESRIYLDYLLRRFAAIPQIWWSMANEFDMIPSKTMEDWYELEEFISANDPYRHLLSNHNCCSFYDFTRPNITHCSVQTIQIEHGTEWLKRYQKPVVYDECCYEGNLPLSWGNISGFEMVNRFWCAYVQGAYATHGEVFLDEDEVLWWSKGGVLKGESPKRISYLKSFLEELPGPIEPWLAESKMMDPFLRLFHELSEAERESLLIRDATFCGRCKEQVFIQYLARHCIGVLTWRLPEDREYIIDVIDVWNMTRETVMTAASGEVKIKLPGREGIAVVGFAK